MVLPADGLVEGSCSSQLFRNDWELTSTFLQDSLFGSTVKVGNCCWRSEWEEARIPDIPAKRDTKEKGKHRKKRWEWVRNNG